MPFVIAQIARGRSAEKRRRLAIAITDAVTEIFEIDRGATQVLIQEHDRESWAVGGELLSDKQTAPSADLPDLESLFRKPVGKAAGKPATKPAAKPAASAGSRKPAAKPRPPR